MGVGRGDTPHSCIGVQRETPRASAGWCRGLESLPTKPAPCKRGPRSSLCSSALSCIVGGWGGVHASQSHATGRPGPPLRAGCEAGVCCHTLHPATARRSEGLKPTLRQTCLWPKPGAQVAFKDSMVHGILQFTLRIAFRCVLRRYGSLDIRC